MPGVDFQKLRAEITMQQVLDLVRFEVTHRSGDQCYGNCPLHDSTSRHRRKFSVNVAIGRYYCHQYHSQGDQLDLWAAFTKLPLHQAAIDLYRVFGRNVPWVRRS